MSHNLTKSHHFPLNLTKSLCMSQYMYLANSHQILNCTISRQISEPDQIWPYLIISHHTSATLPNLTESRQISQYLIESHQISPYLIKSQPILPNLAKSH